MSATILEAGQFFREHVHVIENGVVLTDDIDQEAAQDLLPGVDILRGQVE